MSTDQSASSQVMPPGGPPLFRLLKYARPFRAKILWAVSCSVLNKVFDLAPPFIIGAALDVVVEKQDSILARWGVATDPMNQLWILGLVTLVIWTLESIFEWCLGVAWRNLAQGIQHECRMDVYAHVQQLEMQWFEDRSTGGLLAVLSDDVNQLERFLDTGANEIIQLAVTAICVTVAFFVISPDIAWLAMLPVPMVIIGSLWFQHKLTPRYASMREKVGELNARLTNALGGMSTIKSFTAEATEVGRLRQESVEYAERNRRAIALSAAFSPMIRMVIVMGFGVTLIYGGHLTLEGELLPGAFAVLVFLTQRLLWPFTRVGSILDLYQRAMASTRRIFELFAVAPAIVDGPRALPVQEVRGEVRFENAWFGYVQGHPILRGLDLVCPAGRTTAIVGSTGAGKSTLIKLILRFYQPGAGQAEGEGRILLDDHPVEDYHLRDLRRAIALVSQDTYLFDGTVRENIAYGSEAPEGHPEDWHEPPLSELVKAANLAEAHDFVQSLPQGYDTVVGERGQKLSGGQRQRIAMARAILKDAPILILDEATASVDNETEAAIQRSLQTVCKGRTTIVIAHRLSTVRNADCIHVLDHGKVAERGTHEELLAMNGIYAHLWRVQTGEAGGDVVT